MAEYAGMILGREAWRSLNFRAQPQQSEPDTEAVSAGVRASISVQETAWNDVLAVVVSYNGLEKIRESVDALRRQVGHVHIVDNGSEAASLAVLESLEQEPGITVERLGRNRGVAYALNCGVQRAREMGFTWLLTMDQDSVVDAVLVDAYRQAVERNPGMVCLAPHICNGHRRNGATGGVISYAITSGNLVRVRLFDEIGLYDEGLFIDCVDFDFSLRLRRAGYQIHRVLAASMRHQLGDTAGLRLGLRKYYARHSPLRRYYMYRNFMYLVERYFSEFPRFIAKLGASHMLLLLLIAFFDLEPLASYRAIGRGLWDYAMRKQGPYWERAA